MKIHDCKQGSDEWREKRLGVITASNFGKIVRASGGRSDSAIGYMYQLIAEGFLRKSQERDISHIDEVKRGIELEPHAAEAFSRIYRLNLATVGFVTRDEGRFGCSPDRLVVGKNEIVEIKCPTAPKHLQYIDQGPGKDYRQQVQGQMWVGGYDAVHFFSFFPGWPCVAQYTKRDNAFIAMMERELYQFAREMDRAISRLLDIGTFPAVGMIGSIFEESQRSGHLNG